MLLAAAAVTVLLGLLLLVSMPHEAVDTAEDGEPFTAVPTGLTPIPTP